MSEDILGPTGIPIALKRLYDITCPRCENEFKIDLGAPGTVIICKKCGEVIGGKTIALER